jgi:non-ribosomal peptide synthetase component F
MGLLTAVNALLYRYTGQSDLIVGSPVAGREHADLEDQIGFYVNTLALRTRFSGEDTFLDLLANVRQLTLGAFGHKVYPFDQLVDDLNLRRDMSRNALFDVMVTLQDRGAGRRGGRPLPGGLTVRRYEGREHLLSKFDLSFDFTEAGEVLLVGLNTTPTSTTGTPWPGWPGTWSNCWPRRWPPPARRCNTWIT